MIPDEILKKYKVSSLEERKTLKSDPLEAELDFLLTFLILTDHIPNKIIEAQILGEEVDDYTEILQLRKMAREKINELQEAAL